MTSTSLSSQTDGDASAYIIPSYEISFPHHYISADPFDTAYPNMTSTTLYSQEDGNAFPCTTIGCGMSFPLAADLEYHRIQAHSFGVAYTNMTSANLHPQPDENVFVCMEPGCDRTFRRKADLERHYSQIHTSYEQKSRFPCDRKGCPRARDPFHRRDHQRDHYRDFHNEDIMRRGSSSREDGEWWNTRKVHSDWLRCTRCMTRVEVAKNGYLCPTCKTSCEAERQSLRERSE